MLLRVYFLVAFYIHVHVYVHVHHSDHTNLKWGKTAFWGLKIPLPLTKNPGYIIFMVNAMNLTFTVSSQCTCTSGFHPGFIVREGKDTTFGMVWKCSHRKVLKFRLSEFTSGGFWGHRKLVTEMLLHVEIHLV